MTHSLLHVESYARHLLDTIVVRRVVSACTDGDIEAYSSGGEFVFSNTPEFQPLHSDVPAPGYAQTWPPPHLFANFIIDDQTVDNGPIRILPGTMMKHAPSADRPPTARRPPADRPEMPGDARRCPEMPE